MCCIIRRLQWCVVGSADWDQVQINTFSSLYSDTIVHINYCEHSLKTSGSNMTSNMTKKIIFPVAKYDNKPCSGRPKETKVIYKVHKTTFFYTVYNTDWKPIFFSVHKNKYFGYGKSSKLIKPLLSLGEMGDHGLKQRAKLKMVITRELIHGLSWNFAG